MKKYIKDILFVVISTLLVIGGTVAKDKYEEYQQSNLTFVPGTYNVSAEGFHGEIALAVTFDEKGITNVKVVEENETEDIGHKAIPVIIDHIMQGQGAGVNGITGATVTSYAVKTALCKAAEMAKVNNLTAFRRKGHVKKQKKEDIDDEWDVVVIGGGGAGLAAAAQAAQDGNTVLVIEKNPELGGNTVISGGAYQSVTPYLVWDPANPDANAGKGYDGKMHDKALSVKGSIATLKTILNWSEQQFDDAYYKTHLFDAGNIEELSRRGVHQEYLPVLKALKAEISTYLEWATKRMAKGLTEEQLTLFSTNNLHIFQTYYGGLRVSNDGKEWCYGDVTLVSQFVNEGQAVRPWLESLGVKFRETQSLIVGGLWYRANTMEGATVTIDGKTQFYERNNGSYVMAPYAAIVNADRHNRVITGVSAENLIEENGRVVGVNAIGEDGCKLTARANKGVIIATGGYAANIKMVIDNNRYWSSKDLVPKTKTTNRSTLMGDGIVMAQNIGAAVTGLGWTQLLPLAFAKNGSIAFGGVDNSVFISPKNGKRYVDELSERDVLSIAAFRDGVQMMGVNGVFYYLSGAHSADLKYGPILPDGVEAQYTVKASELPQLFKKLNLTTDANAVLSTVRSFDEAIMSGKQPTDADRRYAVATIGKCEKRPDGSYDAKTYNLDDNEIIFRILAPATHHTMGGLRIDTSRRVLDSKGRPIPGLYAAGEVTGGIHGGNRLGGNALTEIVVSGRIAARNVGK